MSFKLDLFSATILELSAAIINKQLTCVQLVSACLSQIDAHDQTGLNLNAILERSKTALSEAEALDQELKERGTSRGPLHGIPFVVKGDIAVKGFALTGGNLAFGKSYPLGSWQDVSRYSSYDILDAGTGPVDVESPVVTSLREAGAVGERIISSRLTQARQSSWWLSIYACDSPRHRQLGRHGSVGCKSVECCCDRFRV